MGTTCPHPGLGTSHSSFPEVVTGGGGRGLEDDGRPRGGARPPLWERRPDVPRSPEPSRLLSLRQARLPARGSWARCAGNAAARRDALLSDVPVPGGVRSLRLLLWARRTRGPKGRPGQVRTGEGGEPVAPTRPAAGGPHRPLPWTLCLGSTKSLLLASPPSGRLVAIPGPFSRRAAEAQT